ARLWYYLGPLIGLGLLGKYFVILLVPCTLLLVAAVPEYRKWFARPQPYSMALTALFFFLPVIMWNWSNDWPSFKFHLVDRQTSAGFSLKNFFEFVGGQLLYVSPLYLAALLWAAWAGAREALKGDRRYALLASFSIPTLLFFYLVCIWTNEAEPHWPAFGYLTAIIMMSALGVKIADHDLVWKARRARKVYIASSALAGLMFLLFYVHVFYPILPIKPKYDLVNELYGWDKVSEEVERTYGQRILAEKGEKGFLMARHWVLCSQLMFGVRDTIPVACINNRRDQFDFWDDESKLIGKDAVLVSDLRFTETPEQIYMFDNVEKVAVIPIRRGGELKREFTIWLGRNYQGLASKP
ncbi:MAG: glycosyltransferase family 39 protein, partial [Nitrospinota bacterium]|nr:glycosyltransferase family 39 protein [Nitrospinota bacterium]